MSRGNGSTLSKSPTQYTDAEKARVLVYLDLCDGDVTKCARDLGIARSTLDDWAQGKKITADVPRLRADGKAALAGMWQEVAERALALIPAKLDACSAGSLATIAAIAVDKMLLLRGQPTEISEHRMPQEEALNRLSALVEQARNAGLQAAEEGEITTIEG